MDLYQKKDSHRKLSLRFLSWFLLKQDIQLDTHDSIEDARAAFLLYKMYKAFEKDGRLEDVLDDIYSEGRRLNWRPPVNTSSTSSNLAMQSPPNTNATFQVKIPPQQQSQPAAASAFAPSTYIASPTTIPSFSPPIAAPLFNNHQGTSRNPWD